MIPTTPETYLKKKMKKIKTFVEIEMKTSSLGLMELD
jgi:hypothetical protein